MKSTDKEDRGVIFGRDEQNLHHIVCGFYGMIIFVLGYTFPISNFLNVPDPAKGQEYMLILHIIIYTLAVFLLFYLLIYVVKEVGWNTTGRPEHGDSSSDHHEEQTDGREEETSTDKVLWDGEGVSLYVRLGALLFGLATLIMNVIQFVSECRGVLFVISNAVFTVFVLLQTLVLVRYHKACIAFKTFLSRFAFAHLIAVNLAQWAFVVSFEVTEILIHKFAHGGGHGDDHGDDHGDGHSTGESDHHGDSHDKGYGDHGTGSQDDHGLLGNISDYINETMTEMVTHAMGGTDDDHHKLSKRAAGPVAPGECDFAASLQFKTAPYLFPCIIEYSLIMAAISYKLYFNVEKAPHIPYHVDIEQPKKTMKTYLPYILFGILGTAGLVMALVCVVFIFEVGGSKAVYYFYSTETGLFILALAGAVGGLYCFKDLGWHRLEDKLDANLLLVAFFGYLVVDIFSLVSTVGKYNGEDIADINITKYVLSIVQSIVQVVFILDGLARCAKSREQAVTKSGQSVVLFLLLLNAGLWIMTVFELKMQTTLNLSAQFYGELPWTIIESLFLPMVIFFRFHSTVCLADIMGEAYHYHPHVHSD